MKNIPIQLSRPKWLKIIERDPLKKINFGIFLFFLSFIFKALWLSVFYWLENISARSTEIIFDLDFFRLKLINATGKIYLYEYNNPFYLYIFRFFKNIEIYIGSYHNYFFYCAINIAISSVAAIIFYCAMKLMHQKRDKLISILFALIPSVPFYTDISSESFRVFGACITILAAALYSKKPGKYGFLVTGAIIFTGMTSITYALSSTFLMLGFFYIKAREIDSTKNSIKSYLALVIYSCAGLLVASFLGYYFYADQPIWSKLFSYHHTSIFRAEQDYNSATAKLKSLVYNFSVVENFSENSWFLVGKINWFIQGILFPNFAQFIFFDKPHWVFFYSFLMCFTYLKIISLIFSVRSLFKLNLSDSLLAFLLILTICPAAYYWGPNYDAVRLSSSLSPYFLLLVFNFKNVKTFRSNGVFGVAFGMMLTMLIFSTYKNHTSFVLDDLKGMILVLGLIIFALYACLFKLIFRKVYNGGGTGASPN